MTNILSKPARRYRVTIIEWLSHDAIIEASSAKEAEEIGLQKWEANSESQTFAFRDSGLDGIEAEDVGVA